MAVLEEVTRGENCRRKKSQRGKQKKLGSPLAQGRDLPLINDSDNDNDDNDTCSICYFPLSMHGTDEEKHEVFGDDLQDSQGWLKIHNIYFFGLLQCDHKICLQLDILAVLTIHYFDITQSQSEERMVCLFYTVITTVRKV